MRITLRRLSSSRKLLIAQQPNASGADQCAVGKIGTVECHQQGHGHDYRLGSGRLIVRHGLDWHVTLGHRPDARHRLTGSGRDDCCQRRHPPFRNPVNVVDLGAVDRAAAARITVAIPVLDPTARLHQLKIAWVFAQPAHRWQSIDRIKHLFASRCPLLADAVRPSGGAQGCAPSTRAAQR